MRHFKAAAVGAALSIFCTFILLTAAYARADEPIARAFDISAQSLASALSEFARQSHQEILFTPEVVADKASSGARGMMQPLAALQLLLKDSGLAFTTTPNGAILVGAPPVSAAAHVSSDAKNVVPKAAGKSSSRGTLSQNEGEGKSVWERFRLSRAAPRAAADDSSQAEQGERASRSSSAPIEEVIVTGSRLNQSAQDSAVPVSVYTRKQIDDSGTSTVTEFLNTLPQVSVQTTTDGLQGASSGTKTVQLRGLPVGTTLILINGRRVESQSGFNSTGYFNLNNIPLAAIERIEVLPTGSSAVYGGDALGGVVNIILKQDFAGFEGSARYGVVGDGGPGNQQYSFAAGWKSSDWSLSITGQYAKAGELSGNERWPLSNQDFRAYGGIDSRYTYANPANVCSANGQKLPGLDASCAGVPAGSTGVGMVPTDFASTAGVLNTTSLYSYSSIIPRSEQYGTFIFATYQVSSSTQLFAETMYSHFSEQLNNFPPIASFSVPAAAINNPFGVNLTVSDLLTDLGRSVNDISQDYVRQLVGARGTVASKWSWELAAWKSRDRDDYRSPYATQNTAAISTALGAGTFNPFQDGSQASSTVLSSLFTPGISNYSGTMKTVNGFARGPLVELPSGTVEAVIGAEYEWDSLYRYTANTTLDLRRANKSAFTEIRIPILPNRSTPAAGDILSAQLAARYDDYSDFGNRTSPQGAIEFRPVSSLLMRAVYSTAFMPPGLINLATSLNVNYQTVVRDPLRGGQNETVTATCCGNAALQPQTGVSKALSVVYSPEAIEGLEISLMDWSIRLKNGTSRPAIAYLVNNPDVFPGRVVRSAASPGDPYSVGPIVAIDSSAANFGFINESGVDLAINWRLQTSLGEFTPTVAATEVYRYEFLLSPGGVVMSGLSQANDTANYAPRWKGTLGLGWKRDSLSLGVDGRYTGSFKDVTDRTGDPRTLGNFWYVDATARYQLGSSLAPHSPYWSTLSVLAGATNLFNKAPPYSDYQFGTIGYNPYSYEIQGRAFCVQASVKL